jgi:hypothetical protein
LIIFYKAYIYFYFNFGLLDMKLKFINNINNVFYID